MLILTWDWAHLDYRRNDSTITAGTYQSRNERKYLALVGYIDLSKWRISPEDIIKYIFEIENMRIGLFTCS